MFYCYNYRIQNTCPSVLPSYLNSYTLHALLPHLLLSLNAIIYIPFLPTTLCLSVANSGAIRGTARLGGAKRSNAALSAPSGTASCVPFGMSGPAGRDGVRDAGRDSPSAFTSHMLNTSYEMPTMNAMNKRSRPSILVTATTATSMAATSGKSGGWR